MPNLLPCLLANLLLPAAAAPSAHSHHTASPTPTPACPGLEAMEAVLRERGLLTPGVAAELAAGRRYWREERRLCSLMQRHPAVPPGGHGAECAFTLAEALSASGAKVCCVCSVTALPTLPCVARLSLTVCLAADATLPCLLPPTSAFSRLTTAC